MIGPANVTVVVPDGQVVAIDEFNSTATRMQVDPMDQMESGLANFPAWEPAPLAEATPVS
jgi:hypothetical protein